MIRYLAVASICLLATLARAEDAPPPWTVDMLAALESEGKPIKDCPSGFNPKDDPKQETCPSLSLGNAASYGVSFASETDRNMDWKQKAELRALLDKNRDNPRAVLTHKQADSLMDRIGMIYKLLPGGDKVIVAAMKILQPAEFSKLGQ